MNIELDFGALRLPLVKFGTALAILLGSAAVHAATHDITLTGSSFEPDLLSIEVGDTVVWHNDSGLEHTTTSDDGFWDSDTLEPGDTFSYTFTDMGPHVSQDGGGVTFGEFDFYCQFHGGAGLHGMSGSIFRLCRRERQCSARHTGECAAGK